MANLALAVAGCSAAVVGIGVFASTAWHVRRTAGGPGSKTFERLLWAFALGLVQMIPVMIFAADFYSSGLIYNVLAVISMNAMPILAYVMSPLTFLFSIRYTGYGSLLTRYRRALVWLPTVVYAAVMYPLTVTYGFLASPGEVPPLWLLRLWDIATPVLTFGGAFLAIFLIGPSIGLLLWTTTKFEHLDERLGTAVSGGFILPVFLFFISETVGFSEGPLAVWLSFALVTAPAVGLAVRAFDPFAVTPAVRTGGRGVLVDEMDDPVLTVDTAGTVVDLNAAAEERFRTSVEDSVGEPVADLLGTDVPAVDRIDEIELDTASGRRYYDVGVSDVTDQHGRPVGHVLALTDITEERSRRQRLEVLNRVLRHNLRNDMTAIIGRAELLDERVDDDELATAIVDIAHELSETGGKARDVERLMNKPAPEDPGADLQRVVGEAVGDVSDDHPDVAIQADVPDVEVGVDGEVLLSVLEELLENACEHNDAADPVVEVSADVDEDRSHPVAVTVADNGPGIPDQELEALLSESESPLEHGSGLGLWLVEWGVTRMGADVEFASEDPRGAAVTLRLLTPQRATAVADTAVDTVRAES